MEFEWDAEKAKSNLRKHGITFEEATKVFAGPRVYVKYDNACGYEDRWRVLGRADSVILMVVHTERTTADNPEIIRIISARKADKYEEKSYWTHGKI